MVKICHGGLCLGFNLNKETEQIKVNYIFICASCCMIPTDYLQIKLKDILRKKGYPSQEVDSLHSGLRYGRYHLTLHSGL